jgi:hypothetical protein
MTPDKGEHPCFGELGPCWDALRSTHPMAGRTNPAHKQRSWMWQASLEGPRGVAWRTASGADAAAKYGGGSGQNGTQYADVNAEILDGIWRALPNPGVGAGTRPPEERPVSQVGAQTGSSCRIPPRVRPLGRQPAGFPRSGVAEVSHFGRWDGILERVMPWSGSGCWLVFGLPLVIAVGFP